MSPTHIGEGHLLHSVESLPETPLSQTHPEIIFSQVSGRLWHIKPTATADVGELWADGLHAIGASEDLWAHLHVSGWWALAISTPLAEGCPCGHQPGTPSRTCESGGAVSVASAPLMGCRC